MCEFPRIGGTLFGGPFFFKRILLFRVLYRDPLFLETPVPYLGVLF